MSATERTAEEKRADRRERRRRLVHIYSKQTMGKGVDFETEKPVFGMRDGKAYGLHKSGAIVRLDKDRRSAKERKRARRAARVA